MKSTMGIGYKTAPKQLWPPRKWNANLPQSTNSSLSPSAYKTKAAKSKSCRQQGLLKNGFFTHDDCCQAAAAVSANNETLFANAFLNSREAGDHGGNNVRHCRLSFPRPQIGHIKSWRAVRVAMITWVWRHNHINKHWHAQTQPAPCPGPLIMP